jgi:long-chain acyl-CoA synthetase
MKTTPAGALMHHARIRPKSAAFVFHDELWTYERLAAEAERLARGLAARSVGAGDRVALHMTNRPEMIVVYYACFRLNAIAAPLRTAFKFAELAPILQRLKPALYIGEMGPYDNVAPIDASILAPNKRFIVNGNSGRPRRSAVGSAIRRSQRLEFAGLSRPIRTRSVDQHVRDDRPAQIRHSYTGNFI